MKEFCPKIPETFRSIRLGQGYDSNTGSVKTGSAAFRLDRLNKKGYIVRGSGNLEQNVIVNCSSSQIAEQSFFTMDGKAEISFWSAKAAIEGSMKIETSSSAQSSEQNIVVQSVIKGESLKLSGMTTMTKDVYNCTFQGFREYYKNIVTAPNVIQYTEAYEEFTAMYGDSYVSKVNLVAGSALKISMTQDRDSQYDADKFSAKGGVSALVGGIAVATAWGSKMQELTTGRKMECSIHHEPHNSVTREFVEEEFTKYNGQDIKELGEYTFPTEIPDAEVPEIPVYDGSDKEDKEEEVPTLSLSKNNIKKKIDKDEKKEKDDAGKQNLSLEEYRKEKDEEIKGMVDATVPKIIVEWARRLQPPDNMPEPMIVKETQTDDKKNRVDDEGEKNDEVQFSRGLPQLSVQKVKQNNNSSTSDLGGFVPQSYETTPWTDLCPDLVRSFPLTKNQIFVSRLWTFYLTRVEFLQYLYFLEKLQASFPDDNTSKLQKDMSIEFDATLFENECDQYRDYIVSESGNKRDITEKKYTELINNFAYRMNKEPFKGLFNSAARYATFFEKYDFFHDNPYGFCCIFEYNKLTPNRHYYEVITQNTHYYRGGLEFDGEILPHLAFQEDDSDARRFYPWMGKDGIIYFAGYSGVKKAIVCDFWVDKPHYFYNRRDDVKSGRQYGFVKHPSSDFHYTLEGIGFEHSDILFKRKYSMRCIPMFNKLPFGNVLLPLKGVSPDSGSREIPASGSSEILGSRKCECVVS